MAFKSKVYPWLFINLNVNSKKKHTLHGNMEQYPVIRNQNL
jgi:hypothetical protein